MKNKFCVYTLIDMIYVCKTKLSRSNEINVKKKIKVEKLEIIQSFYGKGIHV